MTYIELLANLGYDTSADILVNLTADYHRLIGVISNTYADMSSASLGYRNCIRGSDAQRMFSDSYDLA
jgi:hypothetical protein